MRRIRAAEQQNNFFIAFLCTGMAKCFLAFISVHTHIVDALAIRALAQSRDSCAGGIRGRNESASGRLDCPSGAAPRCFAAESALSHAFDMSFFVVDVC